MKTINYNLRRQKRREEVIKQKFGWLTPIEEVDVPQHVKDKTTHYWRCRCDCGKETISGELNLMRGKSKSCGCSLVEQKIEANKLTSPINAKYDRVKRDAKARKINFNLTKEQFRELILHNCFYCGIEPNVKIYSQSRGASLLAHGIDRIDSSKGYEPDNSVSCCIICNRAKNTQTQKQFQEWIIKAYNFIKDKTL
jgi:hypothetical protein